MKEEEIIKEYLEKFEKMPPNDEVISFYDDFYQDLMKKAIEKNEEITPEILEKAIGNKPYDNKQEETTKPNEEKGENEMEEKKIRDLLKRYGAEDNEIENFMADLKDTKEEIEEEIEEKIEEDDDYVLSPKNLEVLKATEEGKDLIMRAPEMTKEELKKAIYDFLNNKKSE